jgi:oligosaccharide repeat unit polymerase
VHHKLYGVSQNFVFTIFVWITIFFLGSILFERINLKTSILPKPSVLIRNIYFYLSLFISPIGIYKLYIMASNGPSENLLFNLRMISTSKEALPFLGYFFSLTFISYLIELIQNDSKIKIWTLFLINFIIAFMTVAKTSFLYLFFATVIVLFIKKRIKLRAVIIFAILLFAFFIILQANRNYYLKNNNFDIYEFLITYLLSSLPAFDYIHINDHFQFGSYTFRFFYAFGSNIGFDCDVSNNILKFVSVPVITNVYTVVFPYYIDFGIIGVIIFSFFQGTLFGILYKKAILGNDLYLVLFGALCTSIIMQFIGEFFFSGLSTILQYLFFALLPYIVKFQAE